ncbi:MAG: hypothetical protein WCJ37_17520 [Syntrophus sp. (in: bacteria)]
MKSPIDKLEGEVWGSCVRQFVTKDQETSDRWQKDEISHLRERFLIDPMPSELDELVQSALDQWQQIENKVCAKSGKNREQLFCEFEKVRESYINKGTEWQDIISESQTLLYGAVRNMDWINLFTWILPAADKMHADEYRVAGRMMTAIFYIEILSRQDYEEKSNDLKRIDARWRIVNQME